MKGIREYIVEIKNPFKDSFMTESGIELYADKNFSADRLSNRVGKVVSVPFFDGETLEEGDEVLIDPTILYEQIFRDVKQESVFLVDNKKMYYKIAPNLIVLYRKNKDDEWTGYRQNLLVEPIKKKQKEYKFIIAKQEEGYEEKIVKIKYANDEIDVKEGEKVVINPLGITFWLKGKEYWWVQTNDVIARYELL